MCSSDMEVLNRIVGMDRIVDAWVALWDSERESRWEGEQNAEPVLAALADQFVAQHIYSLAKCECMSSEHLTCLLS